MKCMKKTFGILGAAAIAVTLIPGKAVMATAGDGLYSTFNSIYGNVSEAAEDYTSQASSLYNSVSDSISSYVGGSGATIGTSNGGSAINGRPVITYYPIGHQVTQNNQTASGYSYNSVTGGSTTTTISGSASMEVDGHKYTCNFADTQILLTTDDNTYAMPMQSSGTVVFTTNFGDILVTINADTFTMSFEGHTASGAITRSTTTTSGNTVAGVPATSGFNSSTFVQEIGPLESDPIGPQVNTVSLSESYHENYQVYEERMDDIYAIYTNIQGGTITNKPVIFDVPSGVVVRMTRNGKACGFKNKGKIEAEGTYLMYFYVQQESMEPIPAWAQTVDRAMFTFRIQYTALDGTKLETPQTSELDSYADYVPEEEPEEITEEEYTQEPQEIVEEPVEEPAEPVQETRELPEGAVTNANAFKVEYDTSTGYYKYSLLTGDYFYSNVPNGMVTNGSVIFNTADSIRYELYKDGELLDYSAGDYITEPGAYMLIPIIDNLEYEGFYRTTRPIVRFHILTGPTAEMAMMTAPEGMKIEAVRRNQVDVTESCEVSDRVISLAEDGTWEIDLSDAGTYVTTTVIRDTQPPKVSVKTSPNLAEITYITNDIAEARLTRGDQLISEGSLPTRVTDAGRYQLTVSDQAGNTTTVNFVVKYRINVYAVLAIVMVVGLIAALVIFMRNTKTKVRVR